MGSSEAELSSWKARGGGHIQGGEGSQGHRQKIQKRGQVIGSSTFPYVTQLCLFFVVTLICHLFARLGQLRLLQSLVPATQGRQGVEEVEVLEETTRYIQTLEQRLMDRLRQQGLPARLAKLRQEEEGESRVDEGDEDEGLLGLVHRTLGNEVAERVGLQQEEDKREEERLVREGVGLDPDPVVGRRRRSQEVGGEEVGMQDDERGEAEEGGADCQSS